MCSYERCALGPRFTLKLLWAFEVRRYEAIAPSDSYPHNFEAITFASASSQRTICRNRWPSIIRLDNALTFSARMVRSLSNLPLA